MGIDNVNGHDLGAEEIITASDSTDQPAPPSEDEE